MSIEKYLARYAEPEIELAERLGERYAAVLVVPALGEDASLLDGYRRAARAAPGRVLVLLVVNAAAATPAELREGNAELVRALAAGSGTRERLGPRALLRRDPDFDVLLVDRSSPGAELPPKTGVGLARKIGLDLALAIQARRASASSWLFSSDADVSLPGDYFARAGGALAIRADAAAALYPFEHVPGGEPAIDQATRRYELGLRYHVLGLAAARSPYAFHSLGSAIAISAGGYAAVRGVPKREAGEDFHLLDKLAKVGSIARLDGDPIRIRARRSKRVPFGTGSRSDRIASGGEALVAAPEAFEALRRLLAALDGFAADPERADLAELATGAADAVDRALASALATTSLVDAARAAARSTGSGSLRRRLHTFFDGLRTLRFLHAARAAGLADLPIEAALERAAFSAGAAPNPPECALERLVELERALPAASGPTTLAASAPRGAHQLY